MGHLPTTTRRLVAIASTVAAIAAGATVAMVVVGAVDLVRPAESVPLQLASARFGSDAVIVPNQHRPVAEMVASPTGLTPPSDANPAVVAATFVTDNRDVLGLEPAPTAATSTTAATTPTTSPPEPPVDAPAEPPVELRRGESIDGEWFRFEQTVSGLPVYGGDIVVAVNDAGQVVSSTVKSAAPPDALPQFAISAVDAQQVALDVATKRTGVQQSDLVATDPVPVWFDPKVLSDASPDLPAQSGRSAYRVSVTGPPGVEIEVLVDANEGVPALVIDHLETVTIRVCDGGNVIGSKLTCTAANAVASPSTSSVAEVKSTSQIADVTAQFYATVLGRNSYDGLGSALVATVRGCTSGVPCPMANAFWSNGQVVFGSGFATDDVVGHEFTHGVIDTTADLMYYGQSGAINESIADIFGELIDRTTTVGGNDTAAQAWLLGEGVPTYGPFRNMANPPARSQPDKMTSTYYRGTSADNYGVHTNSGVLNKAAYLIDQGGTFNGYTVTGLGDTFTAKLIYQALTTSLVPGSDYADLAVALPQACQALVSANIAPQGACQSVINAVAATEMATPPTTAGANLTAATCDSGTVVSPAIFSDDAENGLAKWAAASTATDVMWQVSTTASRSGSHSFFGPDPDKAAEATLTMATPVVLPPVTTASGNKLFVRFDHTFGFEFDTDGNYDGGVVEYELNGNGTWLDIKALPMVNGYNVVLESPATPVNPLSGRNAFGAVSPGFQTTRVDLTSLAGNSVKLRFRIGSDTYVGDYGWHVDDVKVYQCAVSTAPTTSQATTTTTPATTTTTQATTPTTTTQPTTTQPTTQPTSPSTTSTTPAATTTTPSSLPPITTLPTTAVPTLPVGSGGATSNEPAQRGPSLNL